MRLQYLPEPIILTDTYKFHPDLAQKEQHLQWLYLKMHRLHPKECHRIETDDPAPHIGCHRSLYQRIANGNLWDAAFRRIADRMAVGMDRYTRYRDGSGLRHRTDRHHAASVSETE